MVSVTEWEAKTVEPAGFIANISTDDHLQLMRHWKKGEFSLDSPSVDALNLQLSDAQLNVYIPGPRPDSLGHSLW